LIFPAPKNNKVTEDLVINAQVICVGMPFLIEDKYFSVQISVKNPTDSVKTFWIFSCTWQDSFITDFADIEVCKKECPANYPIDINLHKNDSIVFNCIVKVPSTALKHNAFKVGLVSMKEDELLNMFQMGSKGAKTVYEAQKSLRKHMLTFKIFWGNPIDIYTHPAGYDKGKWLQ
jgi:hypothetical protein